MDDSPENIEPGLRRASAVILAEVRGSTWRRRGALALFPVLVAWCLLATTLELSQAFKFWWVDPWTAEHTALWMPVSGPARDLAALAERLRTCLPAGEVIAVDTAGKDRDSFYWFLWLASELPEFEWRPIGADGETSPARYVLSFGRSEGAGAPLCATHPVRLDALEEAAVSRTTR